MTGTAVVFVGSREYRAGLEVAIASFARANAGWDVDIVVLHDDLEPGDIDRLSWWHPRITERLLAAHELERLAHHASNPHRASHVMGALQAVGMDEYERVIVLDADVLVTGELAGLLETTAAYATVMRPRAPDRPSRGVTVLRPSRIDADARRALQEVRARGAYVHQDDEAGVLYAVLREDMEPLPERFNTDKRRVGGNLSDTAIIHFSGRFKPWSGGEHGFETVEERWAREALHPVRHWRVLLGDPSASAEMKTFAERHANRFTLVSDEDLDDLEVALRQVREDGDFERAAQIARARGLASEAITPEIALEIGITAVATSRPDEARVALALAATDPDLAPRAWTVLAQLEWTYRAYDAAEAAALTAMRLRPADLHARRRLERIERTRAEDSVVPAGDGPAIGHVAFYVDGDGNYGDVLLPVAVRASIEDGLGDVRWTSLHAHQVFDIERARWANAHLDAIVVGGGGLFLPDTSPNGNSGWQWNVTDAALEALEIPLVVYTVGYNVFPGQRFHGTRFAESVRTLVSKAAFVGLRNHGSVNAVREVVGPDLAPKVSYLPCVTTVYGQLAEVDSPTSDDTSLPVVLLNVAYDRQSRRFGAAYPRFVAELAAFIQALDGRAEVRCLSHTREDERIVGDLRRAHGVEIAITAVYGAGSERALETIGTATVVVGMRGHASMIPFGIGVPIVSLISHAKLRYFLEDIGHLDWGIDVDDDELGARLTELVGRVLDDPAAYRSAVAQAQARLRVVVDRANASIREAIETRRART